MGMVRPVEVRALAPYRIWLRYQDGTEGVVDLSHRAGRGVFSVWEQEGVFALVKLGPHGQVEWPGEVDLCPDSLYLTLTGKRPEDILTGPASASPDDGEHEVLVNIGTLAILSGGLPARALGMVTE